MSHPQDRIGAASARVAVVIPAKNEVKCIAQTVRSSWLIHGVDLVLVVDDGSTDRTQNAAREAGAVVVRHATNRGKAAAVETGAAVVAMRDSEEGPARLLLLLDADLGDTAVNASPLVSCVQSGEAQMAIAVLPKQPGASGHGFVVGAARRAIESMTKWKPAAPLSGIRCLTRDAFDDALPLAHGWGMETGLTIDLLRLGYAVREVPCDLMHRPTGSDLGSQMHRAAQYRDVRMAVIARRLSRQAKKSKAR